MSVATDLRDSLKNTVSGIINTSNLKELMSPSTGYKIYSSHNKNWQLTTARVYKNGVQILSGFTVTNDATTKYGTVTFTTAQASSDRIEVSYTYDVYLDSDIDNFLTYGCRKTGSLIEADPSKYVLADLVGTDPTPVIESFGRIALLKDLSSKAYALVTSHIGNVRIEKAEVFTHIREMLKEEKDNLREMIISHKMAIADPSVSETITYLRYFEDWSI